MAGERGQSLADMSLAWALKNPAVASVIIGASKPEQIRDNVNFLQNDTFTDDELKRIDEITRDI